jgi:cobalamin biosynthesis Co2+ chelatase CbiK
MMQDYRKIIKQCLERVSGKEENEIEATVAEYIYDFKNRDMGDKSEVIKQIMDSITGYGFCNH